VMRSNQGYYTRSHQNSEVKRLWAGIVLGWVTSREVPVLHPCFAPDSRLPTPDPRCGRGNLSFVFFFPSGIFVPTPDSRLAPATPHPASSPDSRPRDSRLPRALGTRPGPSTPARTGHSPGTLDSRLPPSLSPHARPSPDSRLPRALGTRPGPSTPDSPPSTPARAGHSPGTLDSRLPTLDSRARWALARDPRLPTPDCLPPSLPTHARLPTPDSRLPTRARAAHSPGALASRPHWPLARDSRLPTPDSRLPTPDSRAR
jgi:hypothetical protein